MTRSGHGTNSIYPAGLTGFSPLTGGASPMSAVEEGDLYDYFSRRMPRDTHEVRDYIRRIHGYNFSRSGAIQKGCKDESYRFLCWSVMKH